MFYVYVHKRADDGQIFYVGKGTRRRAWDKVSRTLHWKRVVAKYGYFVDIVVAGIDNERAKAIEIFLIASYRDLGAKLVNISDGGDGNSRPCTAETKARLSAAMKGKVCSVEVRAKMSASHKGIPHSEEWSRRIGEAHRGKVHSEAHRNALKASYTPERIKEKSETVTKYHRDMAPEKKDARSKKISEAVKERMKEPNIRAKISNAAKLRGVKHLIDLHADPEMKEKMRAKIRQRMCTPFICIETEQSFECQGDAADWLKSMGNPKAHQVAISRVLTGKAKSAYGYHWRRISVEN